ncbi:thiamin pyrophosphokinase 1-like [Xenia sp. Carnegie-2017]|uniref:thiamin pyrophosphokinase 1-like n=1 Tax=Xenia sp. Carnegie-2017 TaxID=2897299 RepID=UPI001F035C7C|nr:thiamin pyrophosphokinase 1-like [Xenia sp. Carnegie-2017]
MENDVKCWAPLDYLTQAKKDICLLILNRPLDNSYEKLTKLWSIASVRICVDGGANEFYKVCKEHQTLKWTPTYITGDFDSIKPDVMEYYKNKGTAFVSTPDQDHTDFTKAIRHVISHCDDQVSAVVVLAEFSGLLDQTMANVNTLYEAAKITQKDVILLASDCLAFLLQPGKHRIDLNDGYKELKCGLLPIGVKCDKVKTDGLKWNLSNDPLQFGELVSTSNAFDGSGVVNIECSHPLVWTMEVQ